MDDLKRILVLSGQKNKYANVTEGVILHVRETGKEVMSLRLESMMAMRPIVSMMQSNGFEDLEYSDKEHDHQEIGKDMDFGDEDEMGMGDEAPEQSSISDAQAAAGTFAELDIDEDNLPEEMAEKLTHLTSCLQDVCNQFGGNGDEEEMDVEVEPESDPAMGMDDEGPRMEGNDYSKKTDAELAYIQKDASKAAKSMKDHDPKAEAKYLDQVNDASTEQYKRSKKTKKEGVDTGAAVADADAELDEKAKGRDNDTKHTPSLSDAENKKTKKALKAKERQAGKKEAGVEEAHLGAYASKADNKKNKEKREKSVEEAAQEIVAELSKEKLGKYVDKATTDAKAYSTLADLFKKDAEKKAGDEMNDARGDLSKEFKDKAEKRQSNINKAKSKIAKKSVDESSEIVSELSKEKLGKYVDKATTDANAKSNVSRSFKKDADSDKTASPVTKQIRDELSKDFKDKAEKRYTGIGKAVAKMSKKIVDEAAQNVTYFDNEAMPANAVDDKEQKDERTGEYERTETKNKVPKDVLAAIDKRIKELNASVDRYDEKGYNEKSVKGNAIDALKQIRKNLAHGDLEGFMEAQIFFGTLMSPIWDMFPGQLVNYIAKGSDQ